MHPAGSNHRFQYSFLAAIVVILGLGFAGGVVYWRQLRPDDADDRPSVVELNESQPGLKKSGTVPVNKGHSWDQVDNPDKDGWTTEALSQKAQQILNRLGNSFAKSETRADLSEHFAKEFECDVLWPDPLNRVYASQLLTVQRWAPHSATATKTGQAIPDAVEVWKRLRTTWASLESARFQFKIVRATLDSNQFDTQQHVSVAGRLHGKLIEQHAKWAIRWRIGEEQSLRLESIRLQEFEQTMSSSSEPLFSDCTEAVLSSNANFQPQFQFGMNHWLKRTQDKRYFSPLGNPGLAVGDVNGDGLDDLYVCQEANLPNRLFVQQPDGTAKEMSAAWQVDWLEGSRSALLLDLDNDGDQDLAVAILGGLVIASNEGDHFLEREILTTHDDTTSICAADYDLDGDLDIYVCVDYPNDFFSSSSAQVQGGAANRTYHDANQAGSNSMFRNDITANKEWNFTEVTVESGLDQNNRRFSWAAGWEDFDNDGDQDLYVANDFGRNNLFQNNNGRFADIANQAGAEDSASGMSVAWSDFNRDGHMDLYVANMFSSAGERITHQDAFKCDSDAKIRKRIQRFARGSTLLTNQGDSTFRDISTDAAVTLGRWAWSSNSLDIDNNGWPDIAVANGYITAEATSDL